LTLVVLGVSLLLGAGPDALLRQLGLCSLAGQVAMMGLLGDYAGNGGWNPALALRAAVLALVQALVAVGLGALTGTTAWPWLVAIPLMVCVVLLRRDWRRMLAAPPAFPAARMA
jgi:xanthine/uracil/vitamin C permease (AzgA family)